MKPETELSQRELEVLKPRKMWFPNPMEVKCLDHLDSEKNWSDILKHTRPDSSIPQPMRVFIRIFFINIQLFFVLFLGLFGLLEFAYGGGWQGIKEDGLILGLPMAAFAVCLAFYVMNLYRRTWNRRAHQLNIPEETFNLER